MADGLKELENALRLEQAKTKLLVDEVIGLEDEIANRTLTDFESVVGAESREYWRKQLVVNRADATKALEDLARTVGSGNPAGGGQLGGGSGKKPLHNRALVRPAPRSATGEAAQDPADAKKAGLVRNRAQEIARNERIPFTVAFRRAEREVSGCVSG